LSLVVTSSSSLRKCVVWIYYLDTWTVVLFNLHVGRCFSGYLSYSVLLKELNFLRNS